MTGVGGYELRKFPMGQGDGVVPNRPILSA